MTTYIIAVDPGKASGLALFSFQSGNAPVLLESYESNFQDYAEWIRNALAKAADADDFESLMIVCERFTINAQTAKNSQAPYSLEHIGVLKQIVMDNGGIPESVIAFQSPADAKAMFDNPKLKKLGYWHRGGEGHALDAIRHGLLFAVKLGWNPLSALRD